MNKSSCSRSLTFSSIPELSCTGMLSTTSESTQTHSKEYSDCTMGTQKWKPRFPNGTDMQLNHITIYYDPNTSTNYFEFKTDNAIIGTQTMPEIINITNNAVTISGNVTMDSINATNGIFTGNINSLTGNFTEDISADNINLMGRYYVNKCAYY